MKRQNIENMRKNYLSSVSPAMIKQQNPYRLFSLWFDEACKNEYIREPNAMHLATADEKHCPAGRIVLLKGVEKEKFLFYTNYKSNKAEHLFKNPQAALLFWWEPLERQIRITGEVSKLSDAAADRYFATRPRNSQLAATVSPQSQVINNYEDLVETFIEQQEKFKDGIIPRPPQWGGFAVKPLTIEFWQGGPDRLHRRVLFTLTGQGWQRKWLAP